MSAKPPAGPARWIGRWRPIAASLAVGFLAAAAIVAPPASAQIGEMPTNYGERLSPGELDNLVTFLLDAVSGSGSPE